MDSFHILRPLFSQVIQKGRLEVIDVSGHFHSFGQLDTPRAAIRFHEPHAMWRILKNPGLALGEVYMDGGFSVEEGTLADFLEVLIGNLMSRQNGIRSWLAFLERVDFPLRRWQQFNPPRKSKSNVSHHYDLPAEFYELFLDPHRQYSCGYFPTDDVDLPAAQEHKMKHIVSKLLIQPDHQVLDIGCGWGGLSCFIAQETGAKVTGITLSQEQLKKAEQEAQRRGLADRVRFHLCDYRKLSGCFDRVVSVGMFEHVGVNHYREFFRCLQSFLSPDGIALVHSIGRFGPPTATNPWIRKYIFPGGYIPALSEVIPHVEKTGLHMTDLEILRLHYAKTLRQWGSRFAEKRDGVKAKWGERFCRMWEFYLASSEISFKFFGNMVFQMQLSKSLDSVPLTRDYLYV